ncbi:hypothetical protein [Halonatronum saccharophilum]|uniref:hypothetical protein n=1 Tax=Halonatronum saccharophilum TaxID=150060 RepID=UPI0004897368|nr:hypothetical protein [Halonatronum saccharophilum]
MSKRDLSFIKTEDSFKYSVNIRFDIGDFSKLDTYVPTAKNIKLFMELFESFSNNAVSRAHLLTGSYGTGKSLFGTILGTLLSNKGEIQRYNKFIKKIKRFNSNLANKLKEEVENKDPYLLVLPSTGNDSFKQSMLLALQQSLEENGLEDIFPATYFKAIIEKLEQWEKDYKDTYKEFSNLLLKERGERIKEFRVKVEKFDQESYNFFVNNYPKLTSGGSFNPFYGCSLTDVYIGVNREIRSKGYQGIYIIFDEFNKLLEDNIDSFDGKELQDFAELATRSEENEIHLLLISHKNLLQYTKDLPQEQINEWKKVEGRFKSLDASQYSSQIYELMSNVILKDNVQWDRFKIENEDIFESYKDKLSDLDLCPDYNQKEKEKYLLKGCYPLHPLSAVLLPKLSQKVAQNERTIFTFLSTKEDNTLGDFINGEHRKEFPLIRLSIIYDYFEDLMQQELDYSQMHQAWSDSQRALQKIRGVESSKLEFIKSLGVINAVNNFTEIPPSKQILRFALDYLSDEEFDGLIDELINDKIIIYRKSLGQFKFFEGSDLDFNTKINEKKEEREGSFSARYLLKEYFTPPFVYPKGYNYKYKIKRYFAGEYLTIQEVKGIKDWDKFLIKSNKKKRYNSKIYQDGVIVYLLAENKRQIEEAKKIVKDILHRRIIFVIPKKPLKIEGLLRELDAQDILKKDKLFLEQDSLAEKELNAYMEETKQLLDNKLTRFIEPYYNKSYYYNSGNLKSNIKSRKDLSKTVTEICMDCFNKTPIINNELIVRDKITGQQRKARKEIVNSMIFGELKERLGIEGYGPEFLLYRTMFIKSNLLVEVDNSEQMKFNLELEDDSKRVDRRLKEVLELIEKEVYSSEKEVNLSQVYNKLRKPPYGLRLGIIPILLVVTGRLNNTLKNIVIRHNGEEREINVKLFEDINRYPSRFTIELTKWDQVKENYISFLEELYIDRLEGNSSNEVNRLKKLYTAIKGWYQALPKYSRETGEISKESMMLRRIISRRNNEAKKLLLDIIPKKILKSELNGDNIDNLRSIILNFVKEHNQSYNYLLNDLQINIIDLFSNTKSATFMDSLVLWYNNLADKAKNYTYDREVNAFLNILRKLKNSEVSDGKLLEEIGMILTGFDIRDWNDNTTKQFLDQLEKIKGKVEGQELVEEVESEDSYEFVLVDKSGQKYQRNFEEVELEGLAKVLENKVSSSFKDMGSVVSDKEKQQILIKLLKDMFKEEGIA